MGKAYIRDSNQSTTRILRHFVAYKQIFSVNYKIVEIFNIVCTIIRKNYMKSCIISFIKYSSR